MEPKADDVLPAFEILLEEIEDEVLGINKQGAAAFDAGNYELARRVLERANRLTEMRHKIAALSDEWEQLLPAEVVREPTSENGKETTEQSRSARIPRGIRTPESAFYRPLLRALVELGGSARMDDALNRIEQSMRDVLKPIDYQPLKSSSELRWRNTAQWARNTMVRQGQMKDTSPRGIWEISDAGRSFLNGNG